MPQPSRLNCLTQQFCLRAGPFQRLGPVSVQVSDEFSNEMVQVVYVMEKSAFNGISCARRVTHENEKEERKKKTTPL